MSISFEALPGLALFSSVVAFVALSAALAVEKASKLSGAKTSALAGAAAALAVLVLAWAVVTSMATTLDPVAKGITGGTVLTFYFWSLRPGLVQKGLAFVGVVVVLSFAVIVALPTSTLNALVGRNY